MRIKKLTENQRPFKSMNMDWQAFSHALPRMQTALNALDDGVHIYRGLTRALAEVKFKPQMPMGHRKSANTHNYYTLLLDNMKTWKSYPARSASVIASMDASYALSYGDLYLCIPEGDPQVGICPAQDLWDSFNHMTQVLAPQGPHNMDDLNMCIRNAARVLVHETEVDSYSDLIFLLKRILQAYAQITMAKKRDLYTSTIVFLDYLSKGDLESQLEHLLDPNLNNFTHHAWHEMDAYVGHEYEVWFSAPTWLIHVESLPSHMKKPTKSQLLEHVNKEITQASQGA